MTHEATLDGIRKGTRLFRLVLWCGTISMLHAHGEESASRTVTDRTPAFPPVNSSAPATAPPTLTPKLIRSSLAAPEVIGRIKEATVFLEIKAGSLRASGTGFVVRAEGETVLLATSRHLVDLHENETDAKLGRPGPTIDPVVSAVIRSGGGSDREQACAASVLSGFEPDSGDVAILRIEGVRNPPRPLELACSEEALVETMPVLIGGFPFGRIDRMLGRAAEANPSITIHRGSVSSLRMDSSLQLAHIQVDALLNPGNSGGPVMDDEGRVIGVVATQVGNTLAFAVPSSKLARLLPDRIDQTTLPLVVEQARPGPGSADGEDRASVPIPSRPRAMSFIESRGTPRQGPLHERFSFAKLGPLIDPDQDCRLDRTNLSATIAIPAGRHRLRPQAASSNAPMTLMAIAGDFVSQVRVSGPQPGINRLPVRPPGSTPSFQAAGLILRQDPLNSLRLERTAYTQGESQAIRREVQLEIVRNGRTSKRVSLPIPQSDLYLRLIRVGGAIECLYGPDGKRWTRLWTLEGAFPEPLELGLSASNVSPNELRARFEELVLLETETSP